MTNENLICFTYDIGWGVAIDPKKVLNLVEIADPNKVLPENELTFAIYFHDGNGNRNKEEMYYINTKTEEERKLIRDFFEEILKNIGPHFEGYQRREN